ncbi:MAG TPA: 3-hydroxyacyl-CoA dehydrogenase NAD-binding domain-containing protein, partial [Bryobacteraceae bacterium]
PPVNALSPGVPEAIQAHIESAAADLTVRAIVVIGAGRTFIAGADIKELEAAASGASPSPPRLHPMLRAIEDCPKPVVMAIHGTALGGGLEVAMAGHYRVASPDAQMGQPEVNLGIIPGAEGTQRLPRLVGVPAAIDLCVSGAPIKAAQALKLGLIDQIVEGDLLTGAIAFAEQAGPPRKTRERNEKLGTLESNAAAFAAGREQARKTKRNQTAPLRAVDAIEAAVALPFEQGSQKERQLIVECLASDQCRALIHAFFAERTVSKIPDIPKDTPTFPIRRAAVVGAGTMGGGISMSLANAGISVLLKDADQFALERGMATIQKNYETSIRRGRLTQDAVEQRMALIQPQTTYDAFDTADIVIEAVFESMALKKQVFAELDRIARPECVLASNTSTLDVDEIASVTPRPNMVVGLHFFSPANVMRLVEIVRGKATSREVIATCLALTKMLRKVGVVVGNCRGFVGNRMMFPYMREAQFLIEEGATPWQVDKVLYDWGMAMGIFAVDDMAGIDVGWRVRQEYKHLEKPGIRQPLITEKLVEMGRLGQKTSGGWYRYDEHRKAIPDPGIEDLIKKTAREAGIPQRAISDEEIIERCIYSMINEGARILEEGYALRASDIDTVYLTGYGFPGYRGGPMWYADTVGLKTIYQRVGSFRQKFGELWEPAPLLARLASEDRTFAGLDTEKGSQESVGAR